MSAFRVQCETCQSWLKVRDEGFVGEVHSCPKCGSMVLIAAPSGVAKSPCVAAAPVVAVMSNTLETTEAPPESFAVPPPLPEPAAEPAAEPVVEAASATAFPWMAVAAIGGVALASVASVAFFLWPGVETPDTPTPSAIVQPPTGEDEPTPLPVVEPASSKTSEVALENPPTDTLVTSEPRREPIATEVQPLLEPPPLPVKDGNYPDGNHRVGERLAAANTPPVEEAPEPEEPLQEIDPLAIDIDEVEVVLRKGAGTGPREKPPTLQAPPTGSTEPSEPTLDDRLAAAGQHAGVFVRPGPTNETTGPYRGSSAAALTYVVPAVDLHSVPLDEAMRLLGDVAGVPITIDPVALRLAGVGASKPIDVVGEGVTLAEVVASSLKPLRLGVVAEGPYVTVTRLDAGEVRTIEHRVADLASGEEAELAVLLRRIGKLPTDVHMVGGKLSVTAPLATHYDLVVLCERLRVARGLPTQTKYPRSLLSAEPSLTALAPVLDRRTTFSFVEPTPLASVFAHWRRVTGLSILVDWRALAEIGYGPRSTVECSVTNRPWRAALDGVLGGLGLTWGAIDGRTLWLTTHDAAHQPDTVELYPPGTAAHEGVVAGVDPVSGHVMVRAAALEQRSIAEDSAVPATASLE